MSVAPKDTKMPSCFDVNKKREEPAFGPSKRLLLMRPFKWVCVFVRFLLTTKQALCD